MPYNVHEPLTIRNQCVDIIVSAANIYDAIGREAHLNGLDEVADFCADIMGVYEVHNMGNMEEMPDDLRLPLVPMYAMRADIPIPALNLYEGIRNKAHLNGLEDVANFCEDILDTYDRHGINGHIKWERQLKG